MSSFEATVLIYGSPERISTIHFRLPVPMLFVFDRNSFENLLSRNVDLCQPSLQRYFLLLLQTIDEDLLQSFENNHRIISIHHGEHFFDQNSQERMTNSFEQMTLDLTDDIIRFLILQGKKQLKLERISLVKIYYQQARVIKDWAMSLFKVNFFLNDLLTNFVIQGSTISYSSYLIE